MNDNERRPAPRTLVTLPVKPPSFTYKIVERIAVLAQYGDISKELNLISYNGKPPKYDIRVWQRKEGEAPQLRKGVTLSVEEFSILAEAIKEQEIRLEQNAAAAGSETAAGG